jgi:uncharacterized protein YjbI with pentapeptide repeats
MTISVLNRYTSAVLATFPGSTLAGVSFSGLNVTDADLSNQDLTGTIFTGCNLSGSTLENSILNGAIFFRANVEGCDFRGITSDTSSDFRCCHFQNVILDPGATYVYVAFQGGQSNDVSVSAGATTGLPDPSIPFYFNQIGTNTTGAFVSLQISPWSGDHGCEVVFGQEMRAFGYDIVLVKLDRGATTMSDWIPTAANFLALQTSFLDAIDELKTLYPGRFFKFLGNWYLGEDDVRDIGAGAALYGKNYLLFQQGIERIISQRMWKKFHIVLTQNWIASLKTNSFYSVRYFETIYAGWNLNVDDQPNIGDNVHLTAAAEDVLGHRRYLSVQEQIASE